MTTNLFEVVNKVLVCAINLPIIALMKCTYEYFVNRDHDDRVELADGKRYCQKVIEAIQQNQVDASSHQVRKYNLYRTRFEVEETFNMSTQCGGYKWCLLVMT